jgi:hypothetical protein
MIEKIIKLAKSQVGIKESPKGSNSVKYNTAYYGKPVSGSAYPWCCAFIWWLFKECGASDLFYGGKKTASCTTLMSYYIKKGQFSQIPRVGSLAFFQFDRDPQSEHIGIVTAVTSSGVVTIEGNTSVGNDSNGGEVMERTRKKSLILGYAYPYSTPTTKEDNTVDITLPVLKKGSKGGSVTALQQLLNAKGYNCGTPDGAFGPNTDTALRKYQKAAGLSVDGSCGKDTWTALLN